MSNYDQDLEHPSPKFEVGDRVKAPEGLSS